MHQRLRSTLLGTVAGVLAMTANLAFAKELDIYYVPTPQEMVDEMLRMAQVDGKDVVYDLGSGDGRIVITAAERFGATGVGIDLDPIRIAEGKANAENAKVSDKVRFINGDLFEQDISDATVVTLYLLESINERLRPKLLSELRPGTRVVSHDFTMGPWAPDASTDMEGGSVYLWVVPANVAGHWDVTVRTPEGEQVFVMALQQEFQQVRGEADILGARVPAEASRLRGDQLDLQLRDANGTLFSLRGKVNGDGIEGWIFTADGKQRVAQWKATRLAESMGEEQRKTAIER